MKKKRRAAILDVHTVVKDVLRHFLAEKGYEITVRSSHAPCLQPEPSEDACLRRSCADIVIMEFSASWGEDLALLRSQGRVGCGIAMRNKAVIGGYLSVEQQRDLERLGCGWFPVPIDFARLSDWIDTR